MRVSRARGAPGWLPATTAAMLLSGLLLACGGVAPGEPAETTPATPDGTADSDAEQPTVAGEPDHAVEPPGDFEAPLTVADMLIAAEEPFSDDVVEQVQRLDGVQSVARLSVGQVPIEGRVYNVAAVDPAAYRNFTKQQSALFQEMWDRVAGGELAMPQVNRTRTPIDDDGYLRLGAGDDAPEVHVGAYAPQVPTLDLVVNERWGETLGLTQGNALVVSTTTTPQQMRRPIKRLVGEDVSLQLTDIATRRGLDPTAVQQAVFSGTYAQAVGRFTYRVAGGRVIPDPKWVRDYIVTDTVPILGRVTCNKHMMPQLKAALAEIVERGLADKIHPEQYAGCYYPRFIAGSTKLSNHAFGLALDINVPGNQRGTVGEIDRVVVAVFKRWGFAWGGDWAYTDPMHFELAKIVSPG